MRSNEEEYFSWWLDELKEKDIIEEYLYESETFTLVPEVRGVRITKNKKGIEKENDILIFHDVKYTPDFIIKVKLENCNNFLFGIFDTKIGMDFRDYNYSLYSNNQKEEYVYFYVDIKGTYAGRNNNSAITFPTNRKLMWQKYGIYVNKIIPVEGSQSLFKKTFYPKKYLYTPKSLKPRQVKINSVSINLEDAPYCRSLETYVKLMTNNEDKKK